MNTPAEMNAIAGALGSIIGYLGAEVTEPSVFERLLWPQRYYNVTTIQGLLMSAFTGQMGGPLHKAALETLDAFRRKGLYAGMQQGHMLGTAFFPNLEMKYRLHNYDGNDLDDEVRNGLWVNVLRRLRTYQKRPAMTNVVKLDPERGSRELTTIRRTSQRVQHLTLSLPSSAGKNESRVFCEDRVAPGSYLAILAGELSALIAAVVVSIIEGCHWFAIYLCVPLFLKLLAIHLSVRREPSADTTPEASQLLAEKTVLLEILDYDHGFPMIEGPEILVRNFFKHWGHPVRQTYWDRMREVSGIALVLALVLHFPIGLLSMLWVNGPIQVIWLSYQMFIVVAMHIRRIAGLSSPGRMEDEMAKHLAMGNTIQLKGKNGGTIEARLESHVVDRILEGRSKVQEIASNHARQLNLSRTDSSETKY